MFINYNNSTIEMSKNEAKAAGKFGSDKFNELRNAKAAEPTFRVVIVKSTAKKGDHYKGLTLAYMESYIQKNNKEITVEDENGSSQTKKIMLHWLHTMISNAKAFILGTYHGLPKKHLQSYFDEFDFRFSRRGFKGQLTDRLILAVASSSMAY